MITNDRLSSLTRLIKSLQESHFLGDVVELSFHIDVDADGAMMDYVMVRTLLRVVVLNGGHHMVVAILQPLCVSADMYCIISIIDGVLRCVMCG